MRNNNETICTSYDYKLCNNSLFYHLGDYISTLVDYTVCFIVFIYYQQRRKREQGMIDKIIMWLCHIRYKKYDMPIFYIKGKENDYPKYLLYTENENVYHRMDRF